MKHAPLSPAEQRFFDVTVEVYWSWTQQPRSAKRDGARSAISAVWHHLGWTMRALDAIERLAKGKREPA